MAKLPIQFRKSPENVLSVTNTELASGTTQITLNLADVNQGNDSEDKDYILTTNTIYGEDGYVVLAGNSTYDLDFDVKLNRTIVINGQGLVSLPCILYQGSGSAETTQRGYVIELYQVEDGTESFIVSGGAQIQHTFTSSPQEYTTMVTFPLEVPKTLIKRGNTLRVNLVVGLDGASNPGLHNAYFGTDPANRDFPDVVPAVLSSSWNTNSRFFLPVENNI